MNFADSQYLILAVLICPVLAVFYYWVGGQKRRALERFAGSSLAASLTQSVSRGRQRLKTVLLTLALFLIAVALAKPRWGETQQLIKRKGIDILIAVDVSKSMWAQDLKPSRISRARRELQDLLKMLGGHRVGLIAFAGEAFVHCPPTTDLDACDLFIESVDIGLIQRGGTHIGDAIRTANKVFQERSSPHKALILITDGEDHDTSPIEAAKESKELGVHIYAIGMGTPSGSLIPLTDADGNQSYLKDRKGQVVQVRLDEETLQKIALETGGAYHRATGAGLELEEIFKKIESMEKTDLESEKLQRYQHRYQIFLLAAFCLLLVEFGLSDRKRQSLSTETRFEQIAVAATE